MNLEDERRLKFDRRLRNRGNLVTRPELEAYEASLPDVSQKISQTEGSSDATSPAAQVGSGSAKASS